VKKSFIFFAVVIYSLLFLFGYKHVEKIFASDPSACLTQQQNCQNGCYNKDGDAFMNCMNSCYSQSMACLGNNAQPQVQQPQQKVQLPVVQQPQQNIQPTVLEDIPRIAEKGKPFWHDYSGELTDLLGPDSPGCPCSFNLDTLGGFPPMGLILGPDGVLKGTPTGKDSKFRACVKDVGGNTACKIINIDVTKEGESEFVLPGNFHLTEVAYNNLPYGKQFQSSLYGRVVIGMPDGSLMYMDKNSTVTPVSDYEVKSDTGRFMYDYKPASGGGCGPIGQSPTWACRQVDARDATLRVKGTEFAVDTDTYGTNITVMEGVLSVSDPKGKKTVEVTAGQYTYIAKWGLPTDPQSFDTSQVDFWWQEKTAEQIKSEKNMSYTAIFLVAFLFILFIKRKQIWPKRFGKPVLFPVRTVLSVMKEENPKILEVIIANFYQLLAVMAFLIGCAAMAAPLLNIVTSTTFFAVKMAGLVFGIVAFRATKINFALFIVMLNIVGIALGLWFGF
jgi:hypothetical protein